MIKLLLIPTVIFLCLALNRTFKAIGLVKKNYKGASIPYSGGTIIFIGLSLAFLGYYAYREISLLKFLFFLVISLCLYIIGIIDDLFGNPEIKGLKENIKSLFAKKFSTGLIKAPLIFVISCVVYYVFNEEYWILKGIITALITNLFNLFDLRPGRALKFYYIFSFLIYMGSMRWCRELFIILFVVITVYYYFDAYGFSMLGDGGSNLIGFLTGYMLCEVLPSGLIPLLLILVMLLLIQFTFDKYSLTGLIKRRLWLDFLDKFLTERQDGEDVKS